MDESRSFLAADITTLVQRLTIDEKIALLGAPNFWNTTAVPRLGIPGIRMSDGPNGVRGSSHFVGQPSVCLPCATGLASTFDVPLIHDVGRFLGEEAKSKSSVVLLAPTCNIQRSPLGGRSFESFSEDPYLSGTLAASYVNGLQSGGVSATIKHFVANDQEHERTAADSVISERALREIYLYPFMLAQKLAQPGAYMTSYGRIDGVHCSENRALLQGILRNEWGFRGLVISDWYGTYGVDEALNAGLDLEMPGPPRWRTPLLTNHVLTAQKLSLTTLNARVANLLSFVQAQARSNPDVVYGDGAELTRDSPEGRAFCRKLAADAVVLLKNDGDLLPLSSSKIKSLAIMGPNAKLQIISGGGSAALKPNYAISPFAGLVSAAPDEVHIKYTVGSQADKYLPTLEQKLIAPSGQQGWLCTFYNHALDGSLAQPVATFVLNDTRVKLVDFLPPGLTPTWSIKLEGRLTVEESGPFELGLTVAGRAKLWVNGEMTIDNWTKQTPGDFFYGQGSVEEREIVQLTANVGVDILVEYTNTSPPRENDEVGSQPALMRGVRLGGREKIDEDAAIAEAITLAEECDAVVVVAGLTPEWESEGFDRPSLTLPGRQDELIAKVSAVNKNTIVCIQAGSATSMPWVGDVRAIVQAWYLGNEAGNAIADVLWGKVNPSGKLPITFPVKEQDSPAYLNTKSENGKIYYREDLFVGYKHYRARAVEPLFPFGAGLSYTTFSLSHLAISPIRERGNEIEFNVSVTVTNTGLTPGSQVAMVFISYPDIGLVTPEYQLKGFAKAKHLQAGASQRLDILLDRYALAFWDTLTHSWSVKPGRYTISVGTSAVDLELQDALELQSGCSWQGL